MYKVKEAADVLGVTRVEIFEIMVSQRELFEPYVSKTNSITYISEDGLSLLRKMLKGSYTDLERTEEVDSDIAEEVEAFEVTATDEADTSEEVLAEVSQESKGNLKYSKKASDELEDPTEQFEDIEAGDDLIGQWLKEIQVEDEEADLQDEMLRQMRTQLTQMRNKILSLDSEIRRKDDAIKHYHEIMKDDVRWLEDLERKVQLIVKHNILEKEDLVEDEHEEDKGNRFKFFKK